jgi:hypothetical protein
MAKDIFGTWIPGFTEAALSSDGSGLGGSGNNNDVTGIWDDPNGHIAPPNTSDIGFYFKDSINSSNPVALFGWSITSQAWLPITT